jgi:hypothetical protein
MPDIASDFSTFPSVILYSLDPDGYFTYVSPGGAQMLGYDTQVLVGEHFSVLFPRPVYTRISREHVLARYRDTQTGVRNAPKLFDERRRGTRMTRNMEITLPSPGTESDTATMYWLIAAEGVYDHTEVDPAQGTQTGFQGTRGIIIDISSYKRRLMARAHFERHMAREHHDEKLLASLHDMGNEIINKMGVIIGYSDIMQKKHVASDEKARKWCDAIVRASEATTAYVREWLVNGEPFARVKSARVDMDVITEEVIELVKNTTTTQLVVNKFLHIPHPVVYGERLQIYKALLTLAMKACHHIQDAATLVFTSDTVHFDSAFIKKHELLSNAHTSLCYSIIVHTQHLQVHPRSRTITPVNADEFTEEEKKLGLHHAYTYLQKQGALLEITSEPHSGIKYDIYFSAVDDTREGTDA